MVARLKPRAAALLALALLAPATSLAATETLQSVREALRALPGTVPLRGTIERAVTMERKDRPLEAGRALFQFSAGPGGIEIGYPESLLKQLRAERGNTDPEKPQPAQRTLENFDAADVSDLINVALGLHSDLEGATLKSETPATYEGREARLLELDLQVRTSRANSKWMKSASRSLKLWIGPDNIPLASESEFTFRAGFLMFNFDGKDLRKSSYARVGDRLVALKTTSRFDGDGIGESQHNWFENIVQVKPGA